MVVDGTGKFSFIEFDFKYKSSLKSFNHHGEKNLAYVCVVDNFNLNLTPLGRFVMPPPMFEKQISLGVFPLHLDMFGHQIAALCSDGNLVLADCMDHLNTFKIDVSSLVNIFDVTKMLIFKMKISST